MQTFDRKVTIRLAVAYLIGKSIINWFSIALSPVQKFFYTISTNHLTIDVLTFKTSKRKSKGGNYTNIH